MIIGSAVEFGCAEVPAVAWCRISSMNVIGCSCVELCCMPGISCMALSGVGAGLALCWGCKGCALCPKVVVENGINKITKTDINERFISIPKFSLLGAQNVGPQVFDPKMETLTDKCRK